MKKIIVVIEYEHYYAERWNSVLSLLGEEFDFQILPRLPGASYFSFVASTVESGGFLILGNMYANRIATGAPVYQAVNSVGWGDFVAMATGSYPDLFDISLAPVAQIKASDQRYCEFAEKLATFLMGKKMLFLNELGSYKPRRSRSHNTIMKEILPNNPDIARLCKKMGVNL